MSTNTNTDTIPLEALSPDTVPLVTDTDTFLADFRRPRDAPPRTAPPHYPSAPVAPAVTRQHRLQLRAPQQLAPSSPAEISPICNRTASPDDMPGPHSAWLPSAWRVRLSPAASNPRRCPKPSRPLPDHRRHLTPSAPPPPPGATWPPPPPRGRALPPAPPQAHSWPGPQPPPCPEWTPHPPPPQPQPPPPQPCHSRLHDGCPMEHCKPRRRV